MAYPSASDDNRTLDPVTPGVEELAHAAEVGAEGDVNSETLTASDGTVVTAQELQPEPPSSEEQAEVEQWWERTNNVAGYDCASTQYAQDESDVLLDAAGPGGNDAAIRTNMIYLNARQTVAMMVPADHRVRWSPTPDVDLVEGDSYDPQNPQDMALKEEMRRWDVARKGFAQCLNKAVPVLAKEAKAQEHLEAWAQDGCHHQTVCMTVFWQNPEDPKPSSTVNVNDSNRTNDRMRQVSSTIAGGAATNHGSTINELERTTDTLETEQPFVRAGLYFSNIPLPDWRIDDSVQGYEEREKATWWSCDFFLTDEEIVEQFDGVTITQLRRSDCAYTLSGGGGGEKGSNTGMTWERRTGIVWSDDGMPYVYSGSNNSDRKSISGAVTRRVREIWDAITRQRLVIIEGLGGYALQEPWPEELRGHFPMELLCYNRRHRSVYGISDTQLQAPTQYKINKLRSDEEAGRDASKPRWGMDAGRAGGNAGEVLLDVSQTPPGSVIGIDTRSEDMDKAIYPLFASNSFNPINYDDSKLKQELRMEAALPEQSLGATGSADFATEIQVAAQGANISTASRKARMSRAMGTIYDLAGRYTVWNMSPEAMAKIVGPLALRYWPAEPEARLDMLDSLTLSVQVSFDEEQENARKLGAVAQFVQLVPQADPAVVARLAARLLGEEDLEDAINPDPIAAARILVEALKAGGPATLPPEAQELAAQIYQMIATDPATLEAVAQERLSQEGAPDAGA